MVQDNNYQASSIEFYEGLTAVQKRPSMYIGDVDTSQGIFNMIMEIIDNSVDEFMAGYGKKIIICLKGDYSIEIRDFGRGFPVDFHESTQMSAMELVLSKLHAGGKFNKQAYKISGGLHGVGISIVNALSELMDVKTYHDNLEYSIKFAYGKKIEDFKFKKDNVDKNIKNNIGSKILFKPSTKFFSTICLDIHQFKNRLQNIAYLNNNLSFEIVDECYENRNYIIHATNGLQDFIQTIYDNPIIDPIHILEEKDDWKLECIFTWDKVKNENIKSFTNNIMQINHGTHVTGFRSGLSRILLKEVQQKNNKIKITGDDIRDGLICIISIYLPDPKFTSQTKEQLSSSIARKITDNTIVDFMKSWCSKNNQILKNVIDFIINNASSRLDRQKTKKIFNDNSFKGMINSNKFANCRSNNPDEKELIIVEGESAGGSAKQCRDPRCQAILCIQGKLLNVEKIPLWKFLEAKEFALLVNIIGCGVHNSLNITKIKFKKIIIMTDADVDGSHIRTLLLTFFFKYMTPLIAHGYLYIARPPLYKINMGKNFEYIKDDKEMEEYINNKILTKILITATKFNEDNFIQNLYKQLLEYKKLLVDNFQDINIMFLSKLLIFGILDIKDNNTTIANDYIIKKFKEENSDIIINILDCSPNDYLSIYFEYNSFYLKYNQKINFSNNFVSKITKLLNTLKNILENITINNIIYNNPLSLLEYIESFINNNMDINRYKGLGEMNPDQLWFTSLDPKNRVFDQVLFDEEKFEETNKLFSILMGDNPQVRKDFIMENSSLASSIDI